MSIEILPDLFTADYTGEPGERTFFLQARSQQAISTYLVEKQQVSILAEKLREILVLVDQTDTVLSAVPQRDPAFELEVPLEPDWQVGAIGLGYDESSDRVIVSMQPVGEEEQEEPVQPPEPEDFAVRYMLRRDQVRAFVLHALAVVGEGRPLCQLCGLPMDPSGHSCPASNGHRAGMEI
jgi:uncharacterized repeat protein (TIGR03847 family)